MAALVRRCLEVYGRIDVLHNNVGIVEVGGPVETSEESWDRVLAVNLRSMFLTCKHTLPAMERQRKGVIVNIGSIAGIRWMGVPYISYSASKGAVVPFTRAIALQYADKGIRANAILPGLMNTHHDHRTVEGSLRSRRCGKDARNPGQTMPHGPHGRCLGRRLRRAFSCLR